MEKTEEDGEEVLLANTVWCGGVYVKCDLSISTDEPLTGGASWLTYGGRRGHVCVPASGEKVMDTCLKRERVITCHVAWDLMPRKAHGPSLTGRAGPQDRLIVGPVISAHISRGAHPTRGGRRRHAPPSPPPRRRRRLRRLRWNPRRGPVTPHPLRLAFSASGYFRSEKAADPPLAGRITLPHHWYQGRRRERWASPPLGEIFTCQTQFSACRGGGWSSPRSAPTRWGSTSSWSGSRFASLMVSNRLRFQNLPLLLILELLRITLSLGLCRLLWEVVRPTSRLTRWPSERVLNSSHSFISVLVLSEDWGATHLISLHSVVAGLVRCTMEKFPGELTCSYHCDGCISDVGEYASLLLQLEGKRGLFGVASPVCHLFMLSTWCLVGNWPMLFACSSPIFVKFLTYLSLWQC